MPHSQTFLLSWGSRRTSEVPCEAALVSMFVHRCRGFASLNIGCGEGGRTICCVANLRISFMARGALFLKVAPWSYIVREKKSQPSCPITIFPFPTTSRYPEQDEPSCACGWCTRGRQRPQWRSAAASSFPSWPTWWDACGWEVSWAGIGGRLDGRGFDRGWVGWTWVGKCVGENLTSRGLRVSAMLVWETCSSGAPPKNLQRVRAL